MALWVTTVAGKRERVALAVGGDDAATLERLRTRSQNPYSDGWIPIDTAGSKRVRLIRYEQVAEVELVPD